VPISIFLLVRLHQIVLSLAAQENHSQEVFRAFRPLQSKSEKHEESAEEEENLGAGSGSINGGRSKKMSREHGRDEQEHGEWASVSQERGS
jgi:hypothetical protein